MAQYTTLRKSLTALYKGRHGLRILAACNNRFQIVKDSYYKLIKTRRRPG